MQEEDLADLYTLQATETAISNVQAAAKHRELHPKGKCYGCDEPVPDGVLFCPEQVEDCRSFYEDDKRRRSNGYYR